jgi:hypothetical protein
LKLTEEEREHRLHGFRTANLVKACYEAKCRDNQLTPEKMHALCQLTWWGIHWQSTKLPALWTLWGKRGKPPYTDDAHELKSSGFPPSILKLAASETGIVNFYRVYRNSSLKWIRKNFRSLAPLVHKAAHLRDDDEARELAEAVDELPRIPKPSRKPGKMSPASLLTPLFGCLDPRSKFPLVNKNENVVSLLRKLGITSFSLLDQFNTLLRLIGQYGIRDAFMLDAVSKRLSRKALHKADDSIASLEKKADRTLDQKDDADVSVIIRTRSRKAVRLHNSMTNRLTRLCNRAHLRIYEGVEPYRYDALVKNYDGSGKDLLIEAKNSSHRSQLRLAVGQLLDYRRGLRRRAVTDLAVLLPEKPSRDSFSFLADVGVHVLWFTDGKLTTIEGNIEFEL